MLSRSAGLTTIETLVAVIIFLVIGSVAFALMSNASRIFSRESVTVGVQTDVAAAQSILVEDLLAAGYDPPTFANANGGIPNVDTATDLDSIQIVGDLDSDLDIDVATYAVSSGRLERTVQLREGGALGPAQTDTLLTGVSEFNLTFRNLTRTVLPDTTVEAFGTNVLKGGARFVTVRIALGASARGQSLSRTLTTEVAFRN